jgi:hypothetical protein
MCDTGRRGVNYYLERVEKIRNSETKGLERYSAFALNALYILSLLYWITIKVRAENNQSCSERVVEFYVVAKLIIFIVLINLPPPCFSVSVGIAIYLLAELYVAFLNIVFLTKLLPSSAPSASTTPPSLERLLILVLLNAAEVTIAFALFYRVTCGLKPLQAIAYSVQVFGTVGTPVKDNENGLYVVAFQIAADFILLGIFLTILIGQLKGFAASERDDS